MLSHNVNGLAIRQERERQRKSVAALAKAAGITADYLYKIEKSKKQPGYETAGRIADALEKKLDDFLMPLEPERVA